MSLITFTSLLPLLAALPSLVSAHAHVTNININGESFPGFPSDNPNAAPPQGIAWAVNVPDNSFTRDYSSPDIICHKQATAAKGSADVAAGDTVEFQWTKWPAHQGPVIDYMAACPGSCEDVDKTQLEWFKIAEQGLISEDGCNERGNSGCFALDKLIQAGNKWPVKVPSDLKAGNYVMRHEVINLDFPGQSQNYPACVNLAVSGGGSSSPQGVVGTSLYTGQEPGLNFDIYNMQGPDYPIPGPPLALSGGEGSDDYPVAGTGSASDSTGGSGADTFAPPAPPAPPAAGPSAGAAPSPTPVASPSSEASDGVASTSSTVAPASTSTAGNGAAPPAPPAPPAAPAPSAAPAAPALAAPPAGSRRGCGNSPVVARRWVA